MANWARTEAYRDRGSGSTDRYFGDRKRGSGSTVLDTGNPQDNKYGNRYGTLRMALAPNLTSTSQLVDRDLRRGFCEVVMPLAPP
jgi:hypothetical protein